MRKIFSFFVLSSMSFVNLAYGQAAAPQAAPPVIMQFLPMIAIFLIFYFLMIRPQVRRQKEHQKFVSELKRGDEVLTASGFYGRIEGITEKYVILELTEGVQVRVLKGQIAGSALNGAKVTA